MGSQKVFIFLGLLLAVVLLISSEVAASRELAETTNAVNPSKEAEETDEAAVNDTKYEGVPAGGYGGFTGGGNGGNGGGMGGYPGGGNGGGFGGYGGRRSGYCTYGCCGRSYNRRGCRCCTYAAQKPDADIRN